MHNKNIKKIKPDGLGKAGAILLIMISVFEIILGIVFLVFIFGIILIVIGILGIIYGAKFLSDFTYKPHVIVFSCLMFFPLFIIGILAIIFCSISKKENKKIVYINTYENKSNVNYNKNNNDKIVINKKDIDEEIDLLLLKERLDLQERIIKNLEYKLKEDNKKNQ